MTDGVPAPRNVGIVTVSAIPNLTGTSVNPLLRAAHLVAAGWPVTLYLPWFAPCEQEREYGRVFADQCAQAATIQDWLPAALRPHCPRLAFYDARYSASTTVPHPTVPLARLLGRHEVLLLEELERHFLVNDWPDLSAFGLRRRFPLVVSLLHTNVAAFGGLRHGAWFGPMARAGAVLLARTVCHHSLSVVTSAPFLLDPGESMASLNGVAADFLAAGAAAVPGQGAYFIGKLIPEKGLHHAFRLLRAADVDSIDLYGLGDPSYVRALEAEHGMRAVHHGGTGEPWQVLRPYRVFVNCSTSEVLCTATAEALAMRKWVILPRHPSNDCFAQFANCLLYHDDASFIACWQQACAHEPSADPKVAAHLSWAAASRRLTRLLARPPHQPWRDPPPYRDLSHGERRLVRRWLAQATPEGR